MASNYTREWISFFTGCGIPEDIATMYALIFYENRIQKNMLLDLNKEYLKDMGITVMGDVIAILRHAKIIHDKYIREQILAVDENMTKSQNKTISESSPGSKNSTPMERFLKHYTRKFNSQQFDPVSETEPKIVLNKKGLPGKGVQKVGLESTLKKTISATLPEINLKPDTSEVQQSKSRKILLDQEGGYKIRLPSAMSDGSKKLSIQAKKKKVKTVFDRLGESSVSSTTSEISSSTTTTTPLNKDKNPSVFARLGEKTSVVSSTSCIDDSDTSPPQDQLPYAGILKAVTPAKSWVKTTMRADEQMQCDGSRNKNGMSIKRRLGLAQPSEQIESPIKAARQTGQGETNCFQVGTKKNTKIVLGKLAKAEMAPNRLTASTTQSQTINLRNLKRSAIDNPKTSASKKVRFGNISHRLIPRNPDRPEIGVVKNYSKLTMTIRNASANPNTNITQSLEIKKDSLSSDSVNERIGVKARVGNMPVKGRLGNRIAVQDSSLQIKKISTVKDRLG